MAGCVCKSLGMALVEMAEEERLVAWFASCIFMTESYTYNYIINRHHFGLQPLDVLRLGGSHVLVRRWCHNSVMRGHCFSALFVEKQWKVSHD